MNDAEGEWPPVPSMDQKTRGTILMWRLEDVVRGESTLEAVERLGFAFGFNWLDVSLGHNLEVDGYWTPNEAIQWIGYRSKEAVAEAANAKWRIFGFWAKREGERSQPDLMTDLAERELIDSVGHQPFTDLRTHCIAAMLFCPHAEPTRRVVEPDARRELWNALSAGAISATGLKAGDAPRVEIPKLDFLDLRMAEDADARSGADIFARPDTLVWPSGLVFRRVRLRADDVKQQWPVLEEPTSMSDDELEAWIRAEHERIGRKPPARTWEADGYLAKRGVTKPRWAAKMTRLYPRPDKGRPRMRKCPEIMS